MSASSSTESPAARTSVRRTVGASVAARFVVLFISTGLGIVVTRIIIEHFGTDAYAQYMLLVGIIALIPFADLGISAAIVNVVSGSDDVRQDPVVVGTLITSLRVLAGSMAVVLLIDVVLTLNDWWPVLLGDGLDPATGSWAAGACVLVFALTLGIGYGQRILIALGRNHVVILLSLVQTPIVLSVLGVMIATDADGAAYIAVASYVGIFVAALIAILLARRAISPALGRAYLGAVRIRSVRGEPVFDLALPLLVQMIALPIAMQSSRIVLSHVADVNELAEYSLAAQMFLPIVAVAMAAGVALWPVFARERAHGASGTTSPHLMSLWFAGAGLAVALVIAAISPLLARIASNGEITLEPWLVVAFVAFVVVQSAKNPLGNYLTDRSGLRFQALMVTLMMPWNIGVSIVLGARYGAIGPVIASITGVLVFQFVANWWYARRRVVGER